MHKLLTTGALAVAALGLAATTVAAGPPAGRPGPPPEDTIVDIAVGNDSFDLLVVAVGEAGLVEALASERQLTVFAPTDDAFVDFLGAADEAAASATIESLDPEVLAGILLYHVTPGRRGVNSVLPAPQLSTLSGTPLTKPAGEPALDTAADGPAQIVGTVPASNGIVHVVDRVLVPTG